jgi:hypothetical protein
MFALPKTTLVNRVIPKNSFDKYITSKQKKLFTDEIEKIKWVYKLSSETINLTGIDVVEIQIFEISVKKIAAPFEILDIIDKYIPYQIIFILKRENSVLLSASQKHKHATNEDTCVIDWRFSTDWFSNDENKYQLDLKKSLDDVFANFCIAISGKQKQKLSTLIDFEQRKKKLEFQISRLESEIKNCKQFNKKVELNLLLQEKIRDYKDFQM